MRRIRLRDNFANVIAAHEIGMNEMADEAGIARTTLYALQNPDIHPNRVGGMFRTTAWKIVNAFARKTGIDPHVAWDMLMIEMEEKRTRRKKDSQGIAEDDTDS